MKLGREVVQAYWSEGDALWTVEVHNRITGQVNYDSADVLLSAIGGLNQWKWPDIPGLHSFKGSLLHSAAWPDEFEWKVCPGF